MRHRLSEPEGDVDDFYHCLSDGELRSLAPAARVIRFLITPFIEADLVDGVRIAVAGGLDVDHSEQVRPSVRWSTARQAWLPECSLPLVPLVVSSLEPSD